MINKTSLTIVERAMVLVPEFKSRTVNLKLQVLLRGQSASTLNNYIRRIALFVIHFEKLPEQLSEDEINEWRHIGKYDNYPYPVHQLSAAFKGKLLDSIKRELRKLSAMDGFKVCLEKAHQKKWVVYCESSMAGAEHIIRYLGQYTHRIAIRNQRILNVDPTHVTFVAKDYRDRAQKKPVSLTGEEFLRRFSLHVMPDGYVRIRRFGIYHHSTKLHLDLQFVPDEKPDIEQMAADQNDETASERILRRTGFDLTKCPHCKEGRLIVIRTLPRIRSPAGNLPSLLFAKLQ